MYYIAYIKKDTGECISNKFKNIRDANKWLENKHRINKNHVLHDELQLFEKESEADEFMENI